MGCQSEAIDLFAVLFVSGEVVILCPGDLLSYPILRVVTLASGDTRERQHRNAAAIASVVARLRAVRGTGVATARPRLPLALLPRCQAFACAALITAAMAVAAAVGVRGGGTEESAPEQV